MDVMLSCIEMCGIRGFTDVIIQEEKEG